MTQRPQFPHFKPVSLEDRRAIRELLWAYQPQTSELTFTNLFIWRESYGWQWSVERDWLLLLGSRGPGDFFLLPPVGPAPRLEVVLKLLRWLRDEKGLLEPRLERADSRLRAEIAASEDLRADPSQDHFDYVYLSEDLIALKGSRYHAKRNHINKFLKTTPLFRVEPISQANLKQCLDLQTRWCEWKRCDEDMNLLGEWEAVKTALVNYPSLQLEGAAVVIDGRIEAFTFGELLNRDTAVVHIEKANPEIPGLYALINQQFCEKYWKGVNYINREQDLGEEGLKKAKLSYHPDHLVEKYRIRFK